MDRQKKCVDMCERKQRKVLAFIDAGQKYRQTGR